MALGLIETIGLSTSLTAMDAAAKCAEVRLLGTDRVIGVGKLISLTLNIVGDVAAVQAAVEAGAAAAAKVGTVVSTTVIANPHEELGKIFSRYEKHYPGPDSPSPEKVRPTEPKGPAPGTESGTKATAKKK